MRNKLMAPIMAGTCLATGLGLINPGPEFDYLKAGITLLVVFGIWTVWMLIETSSVLRKPR
jgi:hypothetical protein